MSQLQAAVPTQPREHSHMSACQERLCKLMMSELRRSHLSTWPGKAW